MLPYVVAYFVLVLITCLLVNTIQATLQRVSGDIRSLTAAQLWIAVIPVFGAFWIFYVIYQTADALAEEFRRRKIVEFETSPGLGVGWAFAFFSLTAQLMLTLDEPLITGMLFVVAAILLVIYWTKIAGFKTKLDFDSLGGANRFTDQQPFTYHQPIVPNHPPFTFPQQQSNYQPPFTPPPADDWERWKPK